MPGDLVMLLFACALAAITATLFLLDWWPELRSAMARRWGRLLGDEWPPVGPSEPTGQSRPLADEDTHHAT